MVSEGLALSITGLLRLLFMPATHERGPDVRLRMVESLSGYPVSMPGAFHVARTNAFFMGDGKMLVNTRY